LKKDVNVPYLQKVITVENSRIRIGIRTKISWIRNTAKYSPRPAVFLWVNIVDCDDGMLDSGLVVVGVGLGPHAEGVGLEAGHAEHCVVPKIKDIWCYVQQKVHTVCSQQ
jgi:hypothetical protein